MSLTDTLKGMGLSDQQAITVETAVSESKRAGCMVEMVTLGDQLFIYRSLNRLEWKQIQKALLNRAKGTDGNVDTTKVLENKDEGEEEVVFKALLFPRYDTQSDLLHLPSGWVTTLADRITELSGFSNAAPEPTRL
ncbi:MAG: hypothetical protein D6698_06715 [Gammaproteobacteria bacterium]|nr:MAG: hypothetical protein D6698_06715 [Gammaproteobacteria bacterium]